MTNAMMRHFTTPCLVLAKSDKRTEEEARTLLTFSKLRRRAELRRKRGYQSIGMSLVDFERLMALAGEGRAR